MDDSGFSEEYDCRNAPNFAESARMWIDHGYGVGGKVSGGALRALVQKVADSARCVAGRTLVDLGRCASL